MRSQWPVVVTPLGRICGGSVVWRSGGVQRVTVIVKATFGMVHEGDARLIAPQDIAREDRPRGAEPASSLIAAAETAPHLPGAGVVLSGHARPPPGQPVNALAVRLAIYRGKPVLEKSLHVFGDRPEPAAPPAPFTAIPLVWERAYGGPGVDENPAGVGGGAGPRQVPNLIHPADPRRPAAFGPIPRAWPARRRLLGPLDARVADAESPDLPGGVDFRYWHAAPLDQQVECLHGDEWIVLDGMSASLPRLRTRLPSVRARARWVPPSGADPQEIALHADTLSIDADMQVLSVVWRGSFAAPGAEVVARARVLAGVELPGAPIPWPARDAGGPEAAAKIDVAAVISRMQNAAAGQPGAVSLSGTTGPVLASGPALPFSPAAPAAPPPKAEIAMPQVNRAPEALGSTGELDVRAVRASVLPFGQAAAAPKVDVAMPQATAAPKVDVAMPQVNRAPEALGSTGELDVRAVWANALPFAANAPVPKVEGVPPAPASRPAAVQMPPPVSPESPPEQAPQRSGPPAPAPAAGGPVSSAGGRTPPARRAIMVRLAAGESFAGADLEGADLHDLDFGGRHLEDASLAGCNLAGARLAGAHLAGATLVGANLTGANVEGADLRRVKADGARFDRAILAGADLTGASCPGASFVRANARRAVLASSELANASFNEADAAGADFTGAALDRADLARAALDKVRFDEARAEGAIFDEARMSGARAHGAKLRACSFRRAAGRGAVFDGASLDRSTFDGADLVGASFQRASIASASFVAADLREGNMQCATGDHAGLARAVLEGADLRRMRLPAASFDGASLRGVLAERSCFPAASMVRADLTRANLRGAELAGANLTEAILDSADLRDADLEGANMTGARRAKVKLRGARTKDMAGGA